MTPLHITELGSVQTTGPLSAELIDVAGRWAQSQQRLIELAAAFDDSTEWIRAGSPSAAHWLAAVAEVEPCTAREWVRIGHQLRQLPATADAFARGAVSYSKVRSLTRIATPENERELLAIAADTPAGDLGRALAAWVARTSDDDELERHQQRTRSVRWRNDPDGMVTFTLRLPPLTAAALIAWLTTWVMTTRRARPGSRPGASADAPTVAQQRADAIEALVTVASARTNLTQTAPPSPGPASDEVGNVGSPDTADKVDTEVIIHVRGDGCSFDDGTPVAGSVVERLAPHAFFRALIHDAEGRPINASGRQRHPSARQKRVVKERDRVCCDCGRSELLEYDHVPGFDTTKHTIVDELQLRCAICHTRRHRT